MKHIPLESQDEAVKRFFLSLPVDAGGSVVELDGQAIFCMVPASALGEGGNGQEEWTDAKNARRCALIDREIEGTLSPAEALELQHLQRQMLQYRRRVAPLPLEDARRLHQELLARTAQAGADH